MLETNRPENPEDSTDGVVESVIPETGGTSVSFRPGTARFLPDLERKPWWIAPSAIVFVPLLVMLLAAWAIPERIGSNIEQVSQETVRKVRTRSERSSSATRELSVAEPPERTEESETIDATDAAPAKKPERANRARRSSNKDTPRRGFSPVREREYPPPPPPPPPPPVSAPEPAPEPPPPIANATRSGEVLRVVQPQDGGPPPEQEAAVEPAAAQPAPDSQAPTEEAAEAPAAPVE